MPSPSDDILQKCHATYPKIFLIQVFQKLSMFLAENTVLITPVINASVYVL